MANMGMGHMANVCYKRKFRYQFFIDDGQSVIGDDSVEVIMPLKGGRPQLQFKEIENHHVFETIYYPGRPQWKAVQWTLFDYVQPQANSIFRWLLDVYRPEDGEFYTVEENNFKKNGLLRMLDGCGEIVEEWMLDNVWPQSLNWGEVDYGNSEILTVDVSLRYDRAYIKDATPLTNPTETGTNARIGGNSLGSLPTF